MQYRPIHCGESGFCSSAPFFRGLLSFVLHVVAVCCATGEGYGSVLQLINVVRVRTVCAPDAADLLRSLENTPRPPGGPFVNGSAAALQTNQVELVDFPWRGQVYPGVPFGSWGYVGTIAAAVCGAQQQQCFTLLLPCVAVLPVTAVAERPKRFGLMPLSQGGRPQPVALQAHPVVLHVHLL